MIIQELRIDNWVKAPKTGFCQINGIQLHSDGNTYVWVVAEGMEFQHRVKLEDLTGIKLTRIILEKAGFVDGKIGKFKVGLDGEDFRNDVMSVVFDSTMIKIHALHQLQNLYFALTGKELEINL